MKEYRIKKTGALVNEAELRATTLAAMPLLLGAAELAELGADPVLPAPMPMAGPGEIAVRDGITQDSAGNWIQAWKLVAAGVTVDLQAAIIEMSERVDGAVAYASSRPLRFTQEYLRREAQARGYLTDVGQLAPGAEIPPAPRLIANFAASAGLSDVEAARLTVKQADDLYAKLDDLADLRMRKYEIREAETLQAAQAACAQILAEIEAIAVTIT